MKEGFSPEEKKIMIERFKVEADLERNGARFNRDGNLEVTDEQIREAKKEMNLELQDRPSNSIVENFEISETRTFSLDEIKNVICSFEDRIQLNDLNFMGAIYTSDGSIVSADFKLKDELAYELFGTGLTYIFEIKGKSSKPNIHEGKEYWTDIKTTRINRFFHNTIDDEYFAKFDAGFYQTEEDRFMSIFEQPSSVDFGDLAEFDGNNWKAIQE